MKPTCWSGSPASNVPQKTWFTPSAASLGRSSTTCSTEPVSGARSGSGRSVMGPVTRTMTGSAEGSWPAASAACRNVVTMRTSPSQVVSGAPVGASSGFRPRPMAAARSIEAGAVAATRIGGPPGWTGLGPMSDSGIS